MNFSQRVALLEKQHYPFRNYPKASCATLLFPGCSFPAQFPTTMAALADLCRIHGVGIAYDCCGKPLAEQNRAPDAARIGLGIGRRLKRLGVRELVCLCPNCMEHVQTAQDLLVISIYALLTRWGGSSGVEAPSGVVFPPCPDRGTGAILAEIGTLIPLDGLLTLDKIPCCGLRGDIAAHGPAAGDKLCALVEKQMGDETLYTYCASCSGQFQRHGCGRVRHLLSTLLGVEEAPDATHAFLNRVRTKFMRL